MDEHGPGRVLYEHCRYHLNGRRRSPQCAASPDRSPPATPGDRPTPPRHFAPIPVAGRQFNVNIATVREQKAENSNLTLSQLYRWQEVLDVPVTELLNEAADELSDSILQHAQLVRLMKSVLAIKDNARQESIRRMAQTLIDQLLEMMPELSGVGPWHAIGKRRRLSESGMAADRRLSEDVFFDPHGIIPLISTATAVPAAAVWHFCVPCMSCNLEVKVLYRL